MSSSTSSFWMTRSRKGCPGHATSIMPLSSRTTAWNTRSALRVGMIPLEITVPMIVTSMPVARRAMGVTVVASS